MKHYFCTITFNNTTNKSLKEGSGMLFYVKVVAYNEDWQKCAIPFGKCMNFLINQHKDLKDNG